MSMLQRREPTPGRRSGRAVLDLRYSLLAVGYMMMISWLASRLEQEIGNGNLLVPLAGLYRIPFYAGLGFFVLQAISRGQVLAGHRWAHATVTFDDTGVFEAFEEWRRASALEWHLPLGLLLDLAGVAGLLLVCTFSTGRETER